MKTAETIPCSCGKGALEVEVLVFGIWKIEKLLAACPACGSKEIQEARNALLSQGEVKEK